MLPDFVRVKRRTERQLLRWLEEQIPELTPLVKGVQRFRQHEGRLGRIVRSDESETSGSSVFGRVQQRAA